MTKKKKIILALVTCFMVILIGAVVYSYNRQTVDPSQDVESTENNEGKIESEGSYVSESETISEDKMSSETGVVLDSKQISEWEYQIQALKDSVQQLNNDVVELQNDRFSSWSLKGFLIFVVICIALLFIIDIILLNELLGKVSNKKYGKLEYEIRQVMKHFPYYESQINEIEKKLTKQPKPVFVSPSVVNQEKRGNSFNQAKSEIMQNEPSHKRVIKNLYCANNTEDFFTEISDSKNEKSSFIIEYMDGELLGDLSYIGKVEEFKTMNPKSRSEAFLMSGCSYNECTHINMIKPGKVQYVQQDGVWQIINKIEVKLK